MCRGIRYGRRLSASSISFNIGTGTRSDTVTVPLFSSRDTFAWRELVFFVLGSVLFRIIGNCK